MSSIISPHSFYRKALSPHAVSLVPFIDYLSMFGFSMSLSEEQQANKPANREEVEPEEQEEEEEEAIKKDIPLVAIAPNASVIDELPSVASDVSASPAFHCLDEVRLMIMFSQTVH